MAIGGIPVVLVDNGTPISPGTRGMPVTIVGGAGSPAVVDDGQAVTLLSADGSTMVGGAHINVVDGAVANVELAGALALVEDGESGNFPVTGTYVDTVSFTVANGVITGITLS